MSKYIRLKYSDRNGICTCYTCGKRMRWNRDGCQAGHGIGGRTNAIIFKTEIIRPQCTGCNIMANGRYDVFQYKLRKEIGNEEFDEIFQSKDLPMSFSREDLETLKEFYKKEVEELITLKY